MFSGHFGKPTQYVIQGAEAAILPRPQYVKEGDWEGFVQCFDNRTYAAEAGALHDATDDAHCAD